MDVAGKAQVIVSASNKTKSYDLATGATIWECTGLSTNVIPTPIYRDGVVYVASGHRSPAMQAIRIAYATGDLTGTDAVLWSIAENTPLQFSSRSPRTRPMSPRPCFKRTDST